MKDKKTYKGDEKKCSSKGVMVYSKPTCLQVDKNTARVCFDGRCKRY